MNRVPLAFCVLIFGGLSVAGLAKQEQATPVVTAAAPVDKVRFAGSPTAVQMRIEVRSAGGTLVFDSDWKDGNILDWVPQDSSGQPLAYGAYRLVMRSKNLAGQTSEKQASLHVDAGGIAVDNQPGTNPKITLTAHDGETGQLITTSGDLSFRFGDFLNRKDTEAMRLTAAGDLTVNGIIRAKGIMLPDGTILTTAAGSVASGGDGGSVMRQHPSVPGTPVTSNRETEVRQRLLLLNPPAVSAPRLVPRPNFAPAFQFVVGDTGVSVGTTNPAYRLDVTGVVNTGTEYDIGGARMLLGDSTNAFAGLGAGQNNTTGSFNTFFGAHAGSANNTLNANSFFGSYAGLSATGGQNSFFGEASGTNVLAGHDNAFFGIQSGLNITSGFYNTFIGSAAGQGTSTESYNTALGYSADNSAGNVNSTSIGANAKTVQSNSVILGSINGVNFATATASTGIATQTPNQYLGVGGGITVDENNTNNGTVLANSLIAFGTASSNGLSGEAIASQRTASGGNQYGLDFYTLFTKRMSIANNGNVSIVGNLTKGSGSFKIDHPLDPENKYLYHSFVESPDMMNIYNGNVALDDRGEAVVQLPDWFEALNQDFRYQLTCLHGFAPVYIDEEISGNRFKIAGGKPGMKISWQVTGIRHDPYANAHRIQVEEEKPVGERGTYLHPTEYGQAKERGSNN